MWAGLQTITVGNIHCHFLSFYTLTTTVYSWHFLQEKKMHSAVPIDHTSNGCRSCVANVSDQTRRTAKKTDEQKARLTTWVSRHNKQCVKRQFPKWALLAAPLVQFGEKWKDFLCSAWLHVDNTHSLVSTYCTGFVLKEECFYNA